MLKTLRNISKLNPTLALGMAKMATSSLCTVEVEPSFEKIKEIPSYDCLNIRLRGYDYTVVEHFGGYVHSTSTLLGIDVAQAWATPAKTSKVTLLKPRTSLVLAEYDLAIYERTVQMLDVPSTTAQILIDIFQTNLPEGVTLTVKEHAAEDDDLRYIPDVELKSLRKELESIKGQQEE